VKYPGRFLSKPFKELKHFQPSLVWEKGEKLMPPKGNPENIKGRQGEQNSQRKLDHMVDG
jgi:hypothetical protein